MKIIIVDDHLLTGQTMELVLKDKMHADVSSYSPENFDYDLLNDCDLLLLDYDFGDFGDAYHFLQVLDEKKINNLKIILFSSFWQTHVLMACRHHLIRGYLNKLNKLVDLHEAVKVVMLGNVWYAPKYANEIKRMLALPQSEAITQREIEIIRLKRKNYSREAIAAELNISINTVHSHFARIFQKLRINSSEEL